MGLKWDGINCAKCGPFEVQFTGRYWVCRTSVHGGAETDLEQAKEKTQAWLKEQALQMLKDLGENQ